MRKVDTGLVISSTVKKEGKGTTRKDRTGRSYEENNKRGLGVREQTSLVTQAIEGSDLGVHLFQIASLSCRKLRRSGDSDQS